MIAREGYVSLATLWNEFERRFGIWCQDWATKCYEADLIDSPVWFGTALDLCEDLFIRSLDGSTLTLLGPDGSILEVPAALGTGRLRLLGKLGVLESAAIADNKMETGKNGRWLMQMGWEYPKLCV